MIDVGTCALHILHGAFRTGLTATSWKVDSLLRSLFNLFNVSPARLVLLNKMQFDNYLLDNIEFLGYQLTIAVGSQSNG